MTITASGASTGSSLEPELLPHGDEDRRAGGGWKGEITWPRLEVRSGLDLRRFQHDVEASRKPAPVDHRTVEMAREGTGDRRHPSVRRIRYRALLCGCSDSQHDDGEHNQGGSGIPVPFTA